MPREYRHIKQYEKEIIEMREKGLTYREIGSKYGLTKYQIASFFKRKKKKDKERETEVQAKKPGRAQKYNVAELKYKLAQSERKIKSLEMENQLMRDFLLVVERK